MTAPSLAPFRENIKNTLIEFTTSKPYNTTAKLPQHPSLVENKLKRFFFDEYLLVTLSDIQYSKQS